MRNLHRNRGNGRFGLPVKSLLLGLLIAAPGAIQAASFPQTIRTESGLVSGVTTKDNAVTAFKGIPYAAPPVGKLRWKAPAAPKPWSGVLKATRYGASCIQPWFPDESKSGKTPYSADFYVRGKTSENCLFVNVWTPARKSSAKLPVMVFFYGGGFFQGSASEKIYDAEGLSRKGVIVVTLNYRLGLLGFLASKELDAKSPDHVSGNYGTLDQISALKWVSRNIAAFGGDPSNVTIFGQSAGGGSVHFLTLAPQARPYFRRAIVQSATFFPQDPLFHKGAMYYKTMEKAESEDKAYLESAGVHSVAQLRAMTTKQIENLPPAPFPPAFFTPVVDGNVIPETFHEAYAKDKEANVSFIIGGNSEDLGAKPELHTTLAEYHQWAQKKFGALTDTFLKLYPATNDQEASIQENLQIHDQSEISKVLWARAVTAGTKHPVYMYYWTHRMPGPFSDKFGAFHTSDVPYVMGSLKLLKGHPFTPLDQDISNKLGQYWANFAKNGNPNGTGLKKWPEFTQSGLTMNFGDTFRTFSQNPDKIAFYEKFFATFPAM